MESVLDYTLKGFEKGTITSVMPDMNYEAVVFEFLKSR